MCGIVGAVGLSAAPPLAFAAQLLDALAHRGPDAEGSSFVDGTWFGFRRLAILDLDERANQPMVHRPTGTRLLFNGCIYNFVELRDELIARGHSFHTDGDTEVLLAGWVEWGVGVFARCNGMFAVAIDDPRRDDIVLARDRFGEKPLFVGRGDGAWWFGSEPSVLRSAGAGTGRIDRSRVAAFLLLGDVEEPTGSYYEGLTQVPAGSWVSLTARGPTSQAPWFSMADLLSGGQERFPANPEEVDETLGRAVALRLRSDVPVGTSLSGGLDSGLVVATIRRLDSARDVHSFTASFPGRAIDEWHRASLVADQWGVKAHRVEPTPAGFLEELDALTLHQGGPIESPTAYAQWCVIREAQRNGVTVLLDGQGADETWGGYPKYAGFAVAEKLLHLQPRGAARVPAAWRGGSGARVRTNLSQVAALALPPTARRVALRGVQRRSRCLGDALAGVVIADPYEVAGGPSVLAHARLADPTRTLLPRLLRYADRNSMASARELRLPYLDIDLVRLAAAEDWSVALESGWTKPTLRRTAARWLPADIVWRREKLAYQGPDDEWLAREDVSEAVAAAQDDLISWRLIRRGRTPAHPWRVLSLATFIRSSGLTL